MPVIRNRPGEYFFEENCFITEWWNNAADNEVSVAHVRVVPGVKTRFHFLPETVERYLIVEGEGNVYLGDDKPQIVTKGDVVLIPAGIRQSIANTGSSDLKFLAVCTPRFKPEVYRDAQVDNGRAEPVNALPVIETRRLVLRPLKLTDANDIQIYAGDFAIADTTAAIPHPYPDGRAEEWIVSQQTDSEKGSMLNLSIRLNDTGEFAGCISIMDIDKQSNSGTLGYWIKKELWGNGICTEAALAVIDYGFKVMKLNRIHAKHFARNLASGSVMKKAGMKQEGYLKQAFVKWGKYEDYVLYAILRQDYLEGR